ncbi:AAA family ATPase [Bradyrhizobium sp.]|uniref:AAA family ATPase n=1 Tax=Bradyrhizobium sp. TaxID=376 RepID=UPI001AECC825|nr:AAA family ATPase [Bradyrhizobium sp.]
MSEDVLDTQRLQAMLDVAGDRKPLQREIRAAVEVLYGMGKPATGALALAWSMLTCNPRRPASFWPVLPQLQHILDNAELEDDDDELARRRLRTWWRAADGDFVTAKVSIFKLADPEAECWPDVQVEAAFDLSYRNETVQPRVDPGPTLVVMPKAKAAKLKNDHASWKDLLDAALPLVVVRDVQAIRLPLHAEFPHATAAVDLLLRDLRDGQPVRMKPAILVGSPGCGKSRLIRRLGDLLSIGVYRFDGGSSADGIGYGGTPRGWSESTPCVPARAVQAYRIANAIAFVDEIDKASSNRNGALWSVLLGHLDAETSSRMRDVALDAELDLSWVGHLATANSVDPLPEPLRDRYRIIRMPSPSLVHLPRLAANVMAEIARDDEARMGEPPLGADELSNIGKVWRQHRFSMRALKSIVEGTLDARDNCAMRH